MSLVRELALLEHRLGYLEKSGGKDKAGQDRAFSLRQEILRELKNLDLEAALAGLRRKCNED